MEVNHMKVYFKNIDTGVVYAAGPGMDQPNMKPCDEAGNLLHQDTPEQPQGAAEVAATTESVIAGAGVTAPADTTAPSEATTAPADGTGAPADTTAAPADTTAPAEGTAAPADAAPAEATAAPADAAGAPSANAEQQA